MVKIMMKKKVCKVLTACVCGPKENREPLTGLHITRQHIEATNGRILFRVNITEISIPAGTAPGVYAIKSITKAAAAVDFVEIILETIDGQYPQTDHLIPATPADNVKISLPLQEEKVDRFSLTAAVIKLFRHTGNAYDLQLLRPLTGLNEVWRVDKTEADRSAKLTAGPFIAIIMPFKLD